LEREGRIKASDLDCEIANDEWIWLGFILRHGNKCIVDDQWEKSDVKLIGRLNVLSECHLVGNVYCPVMDENYFFLIECFLL
jgi:hypothetical protein